MQITLLHATPLEICSNAIRTCWQSFDKSDNGGERDLALIDRVGNKNKHSSTLEHLFYNFYIKGISRACLQELARHRMASLSVKSTRYTLKELKNCESFLPLDSRNLARAQQFLVFCGEPKVNEASVRARSLQNFLSLRSARSALWEIQQLARAIFEALPQSHKYLFAHCLEQSPTPKNPMPHA